MVRGVNKIIDMQMAKQSPEAGINIETAPLLRQANKLLSDAKWANATEVADKALRIDQQCYGAYIVKLLASLKIKTVGELSSSSVSLEKSPNFVKALELANLQQRQELENCQKVIAERLALAEKQRQYDLALPLIKTRKYDQAIAILSGIKDFKDAAELLARCEEIKLNAPKEAIYNKTIATATARDAGPEVWIKCIASFQSISGYKDADDQARALQLRVDKWKQAKQEAEEKARIKAEQIKLAQINKTERQYAKRRRTKRFFGVSTIVLLFLIIAYLGVSGALFVHFIPDARYQSADDLYKSGHYKDAAAIYADLADYEGSEQRLAAIRAIQQIQKSDNNDVSNKEEFTDVINMLLKADVPVTVEYQSNGGYIVDAEQTAMIGDVLSLPGASLTGLSDSVSPKGMQTDATVSYTDKGSFTALAMTARVGYNFVDWAYVSHSYDISEKNPVFTLTIGARWSDPNAYSITYDLGLDNVLFETENPGGYNVETPTFTLANPTREGYTFLGWTGTDTDELSTEVTIEEGSVGDRSFTANWQANSYTLSFDVNGGNYDLAPITVTYDQPFTLEAPYRTGYSFVGW